MENALSKVETITAVAVYAEGGAERIVSDIENEASRLVFDVSTAKGRAEIKSLAHKIARSKVALDDLGKELVSDWKKKSALVDADRKMIRDRLDALKEKVRLPLTEWEAAEEARLAKEALEREIEAAHEQALKDNDLFDREREIARREAELKAAEDARIAVEQAERERIEKEERDRRIAEEAAARAIAEEQRKAAEEKERQERAIAEAQAAAERAEREKQEAIAAAEARRIREVQEAEERARSESAAKEAERLRQEAEARAEDARRAADREHRRSVNQAALNALVSIGVDGELAKTIIAEIASGRVPNVSIKY